MAKLSATNPVLVLSYPQKKVLILSRFFAAAEAREVN